MNLSLVIENSKIRILGEIPFRPMLNYSRTKPKKKIGIAKNPRVQKNSVKNFSLLTKYNSENISDEVYKNEDIY